MWVTVDGWQHWKPCNRLFRIIIWISSTLFDLLIDYLKELIEFDCVSFEYLSLIFNRYLIYHLFEFIHRNIWTKADVVHWRVTSIRCLWWWRSVVQDIHTQHSTSPICWKAVTSNRWCWWGRIRSIRRRKKRNRDDLVKLSQLKVDNMRFCRIGHYFRQLLTLCTRCCVWFSFSVPFLFQVLVTHSHNVGQLIHFTTRNRNWYPFLIRLSPFFVSLLHTLNELMSVRWLIIWQNHRQI